MGMDESMLEKLENQMIKGDESIDESVNEDDDESEIDDDSDDELEGGDILNSTIDLKSSCMRSLNILFSSITASLFRNDVQMQPAISLFNNDVLPFKLNDFTLARLNITIKIPREWSNENDEKSNLFHLYTKALFIQKLMLTLHDFLDYPVDDVISTSLTSLTSIATSIDYHLSLIIIKYVDDDRRLFRDIKFSNFSLIKLIEFLRFDGKTEERSLENKLVNSVKLYNSLSELSKKNDEKMDENGDDVDDIDDVDDEKRFISIDGFVHRLLDIIDESDMENDMLEDEKKLFGEQMMDDDVYSETLRAIINVMDEVSNIHQIHEFDMLEKKTKLLSFYNKNKFQLFNEKGSTLIITHNTLVKLVDYCEKIIQKKSSSSQKTAKNSKIIQSTLELFPSIIDYLYYATLSPHFHRHEFYGKMEELKPLQNYHELQQKNKKLTNSQRKKNRIQNTQNVRKKNKSSINNNRPQPHQIQPKDEFDSWNDLRRVLLFRIYDIVLTHFEKQFIPTTKTTKLSTKPIENTDEDLSHTLGYLSMLINCTLIQDLAPNDGSVSKPNVLSFYVTQQKNFLSYFHLIYSRLFHLVQSLVEISKFTSYSDEIRNNFIYAISTLFSASPFHYLSILSLEGKESSFHSFMELCINELKGNSSIIEMKMNDFDILYHDTLVASLSRIFLALHELKMNGINSFNFTDFKNVKLEEQTKIQNFFKSSSYQQLISNDTFNQLISITWEHLRILDDVSEIQTCLSFIQCVLANYTNCLNLEACKKFLNGTLVRFVEEEGTIPVKRLGETDSPSSKLMKLRCSTTLKKVRAQLNVGNE
ncbi:hypothetical protein SNEBB_008393 [Seison nebaliae]|nr:hypothetical protein SNEBB_008393 [Seison nebaliae]